MAFNNNILSQRNSQVTPQPEEELQLTKFLIDRAADAVFWVNTEAQFLYVNDAACWLAGYSREELLSMTMHDVEPNFSASVWSEHWRTIKQQGFLYFESLHRTKESWSFPVEIIVSYLEYHGREYGCIFVRFIFLTTKAELRQGMNLKVDDYLTKPSTVEELLRAARLEKQAALRQWCAAESQQVSEPPPADTAKPPAPKSIFPSDPQLSEVFHFIEANYHQPITLCDVAEAVGYSPSYLTNLVRRQTGQTVNRWIVERRMAEARALLRDTNQSVDWIAQTVGYLSAVHFFRQFRQHHGTTPQAWRNTQRILDCTKQEQQNC